MAGPTKRVEWNEAESSATAGAKSSRAMVAGMIDWRAEEWNG